MTAMITAAVIYTAGEVGSALYNANNTEQAVGEADRVISQGEQDAIGQQDQTYGRVRSDWQNYRDTGNNALMQLNDPAANFQTSPGYQFRLDEGTRNTENRFSVKGGGGNAMRALNDYSQGMASNEYGNWWNQQMGRANLGVQGTAYTQQADQNRANQNQNNILNSANSRANIGLYGADQQNAYMNDAIAGLTSGFTSIGGAAGWGKL